MKFISFMKFNGHLIKTYHTSIETELSYYKVLVLVHVIEHYGHNVSSNYKYLKQWWTNMICRNNLQSKYNHSMHIIFLVNSEQISK